MSLKTIRVLWRMCFYTTNCNCSGNYQGLITGLIGHNRVIVTTKVLLEWVTVIVTQCWVAAEFKVETRVLRSVCLCVCVCLAVNFYKDTEWVVSCVMDGYKCWDVKCIALFTIHWPLNSCWLSAVWWVHSITRDFETSQTVTHIVKADRL